MSQPLFEYLVENEPAFRKARLPALYSDFQTQRTLNPDGYQANVSAWRKGLAHIVRSGLAPAGRSSASNLFVLNSDEQLLRALESKQYGRPLALGAVVREALAAKDLIPLKEFLDAKESIYHRPWSMWNLASWTMKQLGVADMLKRDTLPSGQFVVISTVEEAGQAFTSTTSSLQSLFERCFSKAHFHRTFNAQLLPDKQLSETDMEVLLQSPEITPEDTSVAQLKELLFSLTHQTSLLSSRIDLLTAQAKQAIGKQNRPAALAALRSKKLAEATLERRFATVNQLEEVAAKIEAAADNVQLVRVMEVSGEALERLTGRVGGVDRVEEVMGILREQMDDVDEVGRILAEGGGEVVDEAEVDEELGAMEVEERRKVEEIERAKREERERVEAEKMQERLEGIGEAPGAGPVKERSEGEREREVEDLMSRMSLRENP